MTDELDIILESYDSNHNHVTELADYLASMIHEWHQAVDLLEQTGAKMACLDPGRLEWYGVVDEQQYYIPGPRVRKILNGITA